MEVEKKKNEGKNESCGEDKTPKSDTQHPPKRKSLHVLMHKKCPYVSITVPLLLPLPLLPAIKYLLFSIISSDSLIVRFPTMALSPSNEVANSIHAFSLCPLNLVKNEVQWFVSNSSKQCWCTVIILNYSGSTLDTILKKNNSFLIIPSVIKKTPIRNFLAHCVFFYILLLLLLLFLLRENFVLNFPYASSN